MKLSDEKRIEASREDVWHGLNDVDVLKQSIPGCESLERVGENQFEAEDIFQPRKLLTPPNMVKLLKVAGESDDLISNLWVQPKGKRTMATSSDPRDEIIPETQVEFRSIEP